MKISQEAITGVNQITDYGDGFLTIFQANGQMQRLTGSGILAANSWQFPIADNFLDADIQTILDALPEHDVIIRVIRDGMTDADIQFMHRFNQAGISLEMMSLGPACRTFNLLISEDRQPVMLVAL